ncbi:MAG TPA: hypothetical protein VJ032_01255, partial [Thermoanaerobaculia bacterium]|nr:hypothetical protein [Thermoanaerobaculia bacterium]
AGALLKQKKYDEAIRESDAAWNLGMDPRSLIRLGMSYASARRRDDALRVLTELEALRGKRFVPSYGIATLELALGRNDAALQHLRAAADEIPPGQYQRSLADDPLLAPLRSDPRFADLR